MVRSRKFWDFVLFALLAYIGYWRYSSSLTVPQIEREHLEQAVCEIASLKVQRNGRLALGLRWDGKLWAAQIDSAEGRSFQQGDVLVLKAELLPLPQAVHWDRFDYGKFLYYRGFSGQLKMLRWKHLPRKKTALGWIKELQQSKFRALQAWEWDPKLKGIYAALFLGIRSELHLETKDAFQKAGLMHLLAISGLHLGIVYLFLSKLLSRLHSSSWGRIIAFLLLLGGLWSFALFTGAGASVLRAATMFSFLALGKLIRKKSNGFRPLLASAVLLLWIDPLLLHQLGFQLSYAAVFGILYLVPIFNNWWTTVNPIAQNLQQIIYVSIAAQAFTAPLSLYYFGLWPTYFLISNLLILPFIPVLMYSGFGLLLLPDFSLLRELVERLLIGLSSAGEIIASWPFAQIELGMSLNSLLLLYLIMTVVVVAWKRYREFSLGIILLLVSISGLAKLYVKINERTKLKVSAFYLKDMRLVKGFQEIPIALGDLPEVEAGYLLIPLGPGLWKLNFGQAPRQQVLITKGHPKGDLLQTNTLLYWGNSFEEELAWKNLCLKNQIDFYSARSTFQVLL